MDRIITVENLSSVQTALASFPGYMAERGPQRLYQVVNIRPMNQVKKRTPLATKRRYKFYVKPNGKKVEVNPTVAGSTGMLRRSLGVRVKGMSVQIGTIHGEVIYAHRIHETKNPREGQYWTEGMRGFGRGWTTKNTGNKFIEKPVRDSAEYVPRKLTELIDRDLKEMRL